MYWWDYYDSMTVGLHWCKQVNLMIAPPLININSSNPLDSLSLYHGIINNGGITSYGLASQFLKWYWSIKCAANTGVEVDMSTH